MPENCVRFLHSRIDEYMGHDDLIFTDGFPEDEIWIKFGGDHGLYIYDSWCTFFILKH